MLSALVNGIQSLLDVKGCMARMSNKGIFSLSLRRCFLALIQLLILKILVLLQFWRQILFLWGGKKKKIVTREMAN